MMDRPREPATVRDFRAARRIATILSGGAVVAAASLLALQLRNADLGTVLARLSWPDLVFAVLFMALSLFAGAYNLLGFTPLRLKLLPTVGAQLAVSGLRIVAPSAISTPAIATRYLNRCGASTPDALATVAVAQTAQLAVTAVVVTGIGALSGDVAFSHTSHTLDPSQLGWVELGALGLGIIALASAIVLLARISTLVRRVLSGAHRSLGMLFQHARRRPSMVAIGLSASAALTLTHVLAFAFCVAAVGGHVSYLSLILIYLASASAGSLIPTPGGVGAVEAALIAGLTATGMALPVAAAAALLSRIVSVWLLAIPGWLALLAMRRRGLL
ncbi:lysylphosphatidylglycerol synthase transmembrane domain-containing protein [Jatrophihabitans sp. DSM 45814]